MCSFNVFLYENWVPHKLQTNSFWLLCFAEICPFKSTRFQYSFPQCRQSRHACFNVPRWPWRCLRYVFWLLQRVPQTWHCSDSSWFGCWAWEGVAWEKFCLFSVDLVSIKMPVFFGLWPSEFLEWMSCKQSKVVFKALCPMSYKIHGALQFCNEYSFLRQGNSKLWTLTNRNMLEIYLQTLHLVGKNEECEKHSTLLLWTKYTR